MTMVHDGTSQSQRQMAALQPGHFNVFEMCLESLLAMGVEHAGLINYYNLDNVIDGTWKAVFTADDTLVLAHIAATDMVKIATAFDNACRRPAHRNTAAALAQAACSYRLAVQLDEWFKSLSTPGHHPGRVVRRVIEHAVHSELAVHFQELMALLRPYPEPWLKKYAIAPAVLSPLWQSRTTVSAPPPSRTPDFDAALQRCFQRFYNAVSLVIETAAGYLPDALARQDHEPSVALFIAFTRLHQLACDHANTFTTRHLDYYYRELLRIQPATGIADATYLILVPDGAVPGVKIAQGTRFTAGPDQNGNPLIYCADHDLWITDTTVQSLYTLYFEKNPLISPESELDYVTGIWGAALTPLDLNAPPAELHKATLQPLFGVSAGQAAEKTAATVPLGFAVTSPILLMANGERRITVSIQFATTAANHPATIVRRIGQLSGTTRQDAFYKVFERIFRISFTAESGWYAVNHYLPDPKLMASDGLTGCLRLHIKLPPEAPPIVACTPAVHGQGYETNPPVPVMRFTINNQNDLFPYSLLCKLILKEIRIDVAVSGSTEVLVYNQHGQIDPTHPFQPFGPLPDLGAYFVVGSHEAAMKQLSAFETNLAWDQLPGGPQGMAAYYHLYDEPYRPELYKTSVTLLSNGRWHPNRQKEQQSIPLFQTTRSPGTGITQTADGSRLRVPDLSPYTPIAKEVRKNQFGFYPGTRGGFFKYTLTDPPYGFGHKSYPLLLSRILSDNAGKKKKHSIPNPPYTPTVKSITIDYQAHTVINMEKGLQQNRKENQNHLYYLHPLGLERIYPPVDNRPRAMVPEYRHSGHLFIGLGGSKPEGVLSLFFHLHPSSAGHTPQSLPLPRWSYLNGDCWCELPPNRIISDTTHGLTSSGIIALELPSNLTHGHTILPSDQYWLRAAMDIVPQAIGHLYSVAAHGLKVTWQNHGNDPAHLNTPLPPGTISQAIAPIAGIGRILQPVASFGGRAESTDNQLNIRASERLRHKNRAVTIWDYERLILDRFPEIFKVKCFAGMTLSGDRDVPGQILIVVIPQFSAGTTTPQSRPMADMALLQRIREHVARLASPFAVIDVCNPVYESVQVRCAVKLQPGAGASVKHIDLAISNYLSPWSETGHYQAGFGWTLRSIDLKAFIQGLNEVDYVTQLSMLHITRPDQACMLEDTAASDLHTPEQPETSDHIVPGKPWSIAVPMKHHAIETIMDFQHRPPQPVGIDDLEIGATFIISGN